MATDDFLHAPRQQAHGLTAHLAQRPHHGGPGTRARPGAPAVPSVGSAGHRPEARSASTQWLHGLWGANDDAWSQTT